MYKISYTGDGATSEFNFAFPFFQTADVRVSINEQILNSDQYGVNPNENFDGGTVTVADIPPQGARIDVFRQIHLGRFIDYQPTGKIDPENLNSDFNYIIEAFRDLKAVDIDLAQWQNTHDNLLGFVRYAVTLIEDKLQGGSVLGLFNNLISVLNNALPKLINDYGSITETAANENRDDYGIL